MEGFFIFECMSEYENVVAIVPTNLAKLKELANSIRVLSDKFDDFAGVSFWDAVDAYEAFDIKSLIDDRVALDHYEEHRWAFVRDDPGEPDTMDLRARVGKLHIDKDSVWWSFSPKHGSEIIETSFISIGEVIELIGNLGAS